jgi:hypothetical protein
MRHSNPVSYPSNRKPMRFSAFYFPLCLFAWLPCCLAAFQLPPTSCAYQTKSYHAKTVLFHTNPLSIWASPFSPSWLRGTVASWLCNCRPASLPRCLAFTSGRDPSAAPNRSQKSPPGDCSGDSARCYSARAGETHRSPPPPDGPAKHRALSGIAPRPARAPC